MGMGQEIAQLLGREPAARLAEVLHADAEPRMRLPGRHGELPRLLPKVEDVACLDTFCLLLEYFRAAERSQCSARDDHRGGDHGRNSRTGPPRDWQSTQHQ